MPQGNGKIRCHAAVAMERIAVARTAHERHVAVYEMGRGAVAPLSLFCGLLAVAILIPTLYAILMPLWLNQLFDDGLTAHNSSVIRLTRPYLIGGFLVTATAGLGNACRVSTLGC